MNVPAIDNPLDPNNPDPNLFIQQTNPLEEAQARIDSIIAEPPPVPEFQLPNEGISSIVATPRSLRLEEADSLWTPPNQ